MGKISKRLQFKRPYRSNTNLKGINMNNRKAKQLRKMAKTLVNRQTEYNDYEVPQYQQVGFQFIKVKKGTPLTRKDSCTRSVYQKMKKSA